MRWIWRRNESGEGEVLVKANVAMLMKNDLASYNDSDGVIYIEVKSIYAIIHVG